VSGIREREDTVLEELEGRDSPQHNPSSSWRRTKDGSKEKSKVLLLVRDGEIEW